MITCPQCKGKRITVYRWWDSVGCVTYECFCRDCEMRFAHSKNLTLGG